MNPEHDDTEYTTLSPFGAWLASAFVGACMLVAIAAGGLWIGHTASVEAQTMAQENFRAAPRSIAMADAAR